MSDSEKTIVRMAAVCIVRIRKDIGNRPDKAMKRLLYQRHDSDVGSHAIRRLASANASSPVAKISAWYLPSDCHRAPPSDSPRNSSNPKVPSSRVKMSTQCEPSGFSIQAIIFRVMTKWHSVET